MADSLDRSPERVHTIVEEASVLSELVREDQVVVGAIEARPRERRGGRVLVDQTSERGDVRHLEGLAARVSLPAPCARRRKPKAHLSGRVDAADIGSSESLQFAPKGQLVGASGEPGRTS